MWNSCAIKLIGFSESIYEVMITVLEWQNIKANGWMVCNVKERGCCYNRPDPICSVRFVFESMTFSSCYYVKTCSDVGYKLIAVWGQHKKTFSFVCL